MKKIILSSLIAFGVIVFLKNLETPHFSKKKKEEKEQPGVPNEHFYSQKMYPSNQFDIAGYEQALQEATNFNAATADNRSTNGNWQIEGPYNIGARMTSLAVQPDNSNVIYAGFPDGGLWKTTDGGTSWNPLFDQQKFLCIADIEIDPKNNNIVYAASGDADISGYPAIGDGLYKSIDAGKTWKNIGLGNTRIVSKIEVNPQNTNILYAGAMGVPFVKDANRGFYKSSDGGTTWKKTLFVSDSTGVIDMVVNPINPNILYVATWDRVRNNFVSVIAGNGAGVYKSIDAGETWTKLTNGLPSGKLSRIGLAIYEKNPNILYTTVVGANAEQQGIYKTTNAGEKWETVATFSKGLDQSCLAGFGWYFGKIRVNPNNPDDIFLLGVELWRRNGEQSDWQIATPNWWLYNVHADKHDLVFTNDNKMILATDGGAYRSTDNAQTWQDIENIPCTQFYRVETDPFEKGIYYGGAQDNGTTGGNAKIAEWPRIFGSDGFQMRHHPTDTKTYFVEAQGGNISVTFDDGNNFFPASDAIPATDRYNWDMQYFLSPHDPNLIYTGTHKVYRGYYDPETKDTPIYDNISTDLTRGDISGGRFNTISTIEESPTKQGLIYVGTADGLVWRTDNDGQNWKKITTGLPNRYVTNVLPLNDNEVIVTFSGYKYNDFTPHIFYSSNRGDSWVSIKNNLPNIAINDVCTIPGLGVVNQSEAVVKANVGLAIATDAGVYLCKVLTTNPLWERVGQNMPLIKVYSLLYDKQTSNIVAGTFSRAIQTYTYKGVSSTKDIFEAKVKISPTVFTEQVTVKSEECDIKEITIFDINGKIVYQEKNISNDNSLILNQLQKGAYIMNIVLKDKKMVSKKIIKI